MQEVKPILNRTLLLLLTSCQLKPATCGVTLHNKVAFQLPAKPNKAKVGKEGNNNHSSRLQKDFYLPKLLSLNGHFSEFGVPIKNHIIKWDTIKLKISLSSLNGHFWYSFYQLKLHLQNKYYHPRNRRESIRTVYFNNQWFKYVC